jgi:hypothetical protein
MGDRQQTLPAALDGDGVNLGLLGNAVERELANSTDLPSGDQPTAASAPESKVRRVGRPPRTETTKIS